MGLIKEAFFISEKQAGPQDRPRELTRSQILSRADINKALQQSNPQTSPTIVNKPAPAIVPQSARHQFISPEDQAKLKAAGKEVFPSTPNIREPGLRVSPEERIKQQHLKNAYITDRDPDINPEDTTFADITPVRHAPNNRREPGLRVSPEERIKQQHAINRIQGRDTPVEPILPGSDYKKPAPPAPYKSFAQEIEDTYKNDDNSVFPRAPREPRPKPSLKKPLHKPTTPVAPVLPGSNYKKPESYDQEIADAYRVPTSSITPADIATLESTTKGLVGTKLITAVRALKETMPALYDALTKATKGLRGTALNNAVSMFIAKHK